MLLSNRVKYCYTLARGTNSTFLYWPWFLDVWIICSVLPLADGTLELLCVKRISGEDLSVCYDQRLNWYDSTLACSWLGDSRNGKTTKRIGVKKGARTSLPSSLSIYSTSSPLRISPFPIIWKAGTGQHCSGHCIMLLLFPDGLSSMCFKRVLVLQVAYCQACAAV